MGVKCTNCGTDNTQDSEFCKKCGTQIRESEEKAVPTQTLEVPKEELSTGSTFAGRFQIIEELGKGGMGRVYKANDIDIKEKVAIKLIKPEISTDKKTIERFQNELKFARKIRHKNVCQMYDLNREEGTYYITMEYVDGENLKNMVRMSGQLGIRTTITITKQVCEGLSEAHKLGVIHRDLKPSNIMIDREGSVRIMDFGIARYLKEKGLTGAGVMIGTPEYMSPEQVEGKEVDQRSDIYSLGVILFEMVTGGVPFKGDTPFAVGVKQKSEMPQNPKVLNPQISEDLNYVIMKCLRKEKQKRYQSIKEILSDLINVERQIPLTDSIAIKRDLRIDEKTGKNSIAVLPFLDLSFEKNQEYFCDGLAEEILNALTNIKDLRVVARASSFAFKHKDLNVRDIGRELGVQTILDGSVRKAGERLRINVELVNVSDGYQLWSDRYDRDMSDIFSIQDEISLAIVDRLKVKLLKDEKEKIVKRFTDDIDAYNLYLKGRYFWNRRHEEGLLKGIDCFKKAIKKDPFYATAYTGLADSYNILGYYGYLSPKETFPKAKDAARKAIEIEEEIAEAHASLGYSNTFYDWNWIIAEKEFRRAIEINTNYPSSHHWYALFLLIMGRYDEAIKEAKRAYEQDPLSLIINVAIALCLYGARRYDESIEQYLKIIEMDPNFSTVYFFIGMPYIAKEMWEEAIETYNKFSNLSAESPLSIGYLGLSYSFAGEKDKANKMLNKLEKLAKLRFVSPLYKGLIYMGFFKIEEALDQIEKAFEERDPLLAYINIDPVFDSLRSEARFIKLLEKMKFG